MLWDMKRVLFLVLLMILAAGLATALWVFRDTPESVLFKGFRGLLTAKSFNSLVIDVAWTKPSERTTTGIGFAGQADFHDASRPRLIGIVSAGEGLFGPEQTADVIFDDGRLALRPHAVTPASGDAFVKLTGATSTNLFAVLDTSLFVKSKGYPALAGKGSTTATQAVLSSLPSLIQPGSEWIVESDGGGKIVTVPFQLDRSGLRPFFIALYSAKTGTQPDATALVGIDQATEQLLRGTYLLTVDRRTGDPLTLQAAWPVVDAKGNETLRIRIRIDVRGINQPVSISIPGDAIDITAKIVKPTVTGLPSATQTTNTNVVPYQPATSTSATDRFDSYVDDLRVKHDRFVP